MTTTLPTIVRVVDHDAEVLRLIDQFKTARKAKAKWEEAEAEMRETLLKLFGVTHHGHWQASAGHRVILKIDSSPVARFDTTAFKADHPDLYESYRTDVTVTKVVTAGTADTMDLPS
jgi:hypothetical protein